MDFPNLRLRRLRQHPALRNMVRETRLSIENLVYPLFIRQGRKIKVPIASMPGCFHFSPDCLEHEIMSIQALGLPAVLLFGLPDKKDASGSEAWSDVGPAQRAIREIKALAPELIVITDICLCAYTNHGHCGVISDQKVDNDATCEVLARTALSHAQAGVDIVAPSDMMDGRVAAIRQCLEKNGFPDVGIMSYAAKYASVFYGPFRGAADSTPAFGDRKTYQMDPCNTRQALTEMALDIQEGADIIMVKPALPYLDIITRARERFECPLAAYNVSGEYMMLNAAVGAGAIEKEPAMLEMLTCIKRAGADIIITYFAKEVASILGR